MFSIRERVCSDQITPALEKEVKRVTKSAFPHPYSTGGIFSIVIDKLKNTEEPAFLAWKKESKVEVLVGYVVTHRKTDMLDVSYIAVESSVQGKGLGTLLMQKVFQAAEKAGLMVSLFYRSDIDALNNFYCKFKPLGPEGSLFWRWFINGSCSLPVFDPKISLAAIEESLSKEVSESEDTPLLRKKPSACPCTLL